MIGVEPIGSGLIGSESVSSGSEAIISVPDMAIDSVIGSVIDSVIDSAIDSVIDSPAEL
jgi:hypothetical protein